MAVIMKIRNRLGVVILVLIGLAIISFLLMDSLNSNSSLIRGTSDSVGEINGVSVPLKQLEAKFQETFENYKQQAKQDNIDEQTTLALRDQAWSQLVNDMLMNEQYDELGIRVTPEELLDMVQGPNPHPAVVQAFSDPNTKKFDAAQVGLFIQNMDNDTSGDTRNRWLKFEKYLKEDRVKSKYNTLVKKGLYVPNWLAKADYELKNTSASFDFVFLPYSDIKDEEVKVTDDDIRNYINNNKGKYTNQENSRTIEFVSFDIKASSADTAKALAWLNGQLENFKTAEDDSVFVKLYSDKPFDDKYYFQEDLVSSVKDTFFKIDTNTIVGPYQEGDYFIAAKLLETISRLG
jgi:peptidyl-prolyl cis-trans isomerase D